MYDQRTGRHSTNKRDLSRTVSNSITSSSNSLIKIFLPTKFILMCIPFSMKWRFKFRSWLFTIITFVTKLSCNILKKDSSFIREKILDAFRILRIFVSSRMGMESYSFGFLFASEFTLFKYFIFSKLILSLPPP